MTIGLMLAAALGSVTNPLLGTWVGEGAVAAMRSTMTITPLTISFGAGRREQGVVPISSFEKQDRMLSVRTRLGDLYRFRFDTADRICRVPETGLSVMQCFSRSRAAI